MSMTTLGQGHAHAKHGDQCLPASNARVRTFVGEHTVENLLKALGAYIVECARFHALPRDGCARSGSGPCRRAASFAGVAGRSIASSEDASAIALAMQTGVDMQLPSPTPFDRTV